MIHRYFLTQISSVAHFARRRDKGSAGDSYLGKRTGDLSVSFFPDDRANPYLDLLDRSLEGEQVYVCPRRHRSPTSRWLFQNRKTVDVIHMHWLRPLYQYPLLPISLALSLQMLSRMQFAHELGYRIVWTMHNLYPHERYHPKLDMWVRKWFATRSDAIVVHCNAARHMLFEEFGRTKDVFVAPLGNYTELFETKLSKEAARRQLRIPQAGIVFLYFGAIRAYKGVDRLVDAFQSIPDPEFTLLIAGRPLRYDHNDLANSVARDRRIITWLRWITDEEVALLHRAADVVVAPFERVTTSSSVMLALSLRRAVIVPALGCLPEMVTSDAGLLYDPGCQSGLRGALMHCRELNLDTMGERAYEAALSYSWSKTAKRVKEAYVAVMA